MSISMQNSSPFDVVLSTYITWAQVKRVQIECVLTLIRKEQCTQTPRLFILVSAYTVPLYNIKIK